ncbi:hypothetical protein [Streptomyces sp. NPDC001502]
MEPAEYSTRITTEQLRPLLGPLPGRDEVCGEPPAPALRPPPSGNRALSR